MGKKIADGVLTVFLLACCAAMISCVVTFFANGGDWLRMNIFGYRMSFVLSESMEPAIMTHALCLTDMSNRTAEVGDVVVYRHTYEDGPSILVVHRVIGIEDDGALITKGDNNETVDSWTTPPEDVIGKIVHVWNGFAKMYDA